MDYFTIVCLDGWPLNDVNDAVIILTIGNSYKRSSQVSIETRSMSASL